VSSTWSPLKMRGCWAMSVSIASLTWSSKFAASVRQVYLVAPALNRAQLAESGSPAVGVKVVGWWS